MMTAQQIEAMATKLATERVAYDAKWSAAMDLARRNFLMALDQSDAYGGEENAIESHYGNAVDSARAEGLDPDMVAAAYSNLESEHRDNA